MFAFKLRGFSCSSRDESGGFIRAGERFVSPLRAQELRFGWREPYLCESGQGAQSVPSGATPTPAE